MQTFRVYPKKGKMFTVEFERFEEKDGHFILYDTMNQPSNDGFLSYDNIAAIVAERLPERERRYPEERPLTFSVYLKNQGEGEPSFQITADSCDSSQPPSLRFFWQVVKGPPVEIGGIYGALSEVVAVMPEDGLQYRS